MIDLQSYNTFEAWMNSTNNLKNEIKNLDMQNKYLFIKASIEIMNGFYNEVTNAKGFTLDDLLKVYKLKKDMYGV